MSGIAARAFPVLGIVALGVVAFQQIKRGAYPPPPSAFVGVALVFSLLAILSLATPELAAAFGAAIIVWLLFAYNSALNVGTGGDPFQAFRDSIASATKGGPEQPQFNQGGA